MFDLISIGDSVVDTFIPLEEVEVSGGEDDKKLTLPLGKKVPVGPAVSLVGGNAANNAIGASRLGLKVGIYTNVGNLGDDQDDLRIINKLKTEGVDTRYVIENDDLTSDHHIVLDVKGERTILVYHQPWKYHLPDLDKTKWLYFTSLSPSFIKTKIVDEVIAFIDRTNTNLLFNPGTFQIKSGVKKNPRLLSLTKLFIVNKEEAEEIVGEGDIKKLLEKIADLGPQMVIITDGADGSYGYDGENFYHLKTFPTKLVEMTGAGDAYATGVLSGLFNKQSLDEAMRWGAANGAAVVGEVGPQAGLLTHKKMKEKLEENSKIIATQI